MAESTHGISPRPPPCSMPYMSVLDLALWPTSLYVANVMCCENLMARPRPPENHWLSPTQKRLHSSRSSLQIMHVVQLAANHHACSPAVSSPPDREPMPCRANLFEPMGMTTELLGAVLPIPPRDPPPMCRSLCRVPHSSPVQKAQNAMPHD
jgi:hypothetical protein